MSSLKISQLPQTQSLSPSDILPSVANGTTSKITVQDLANSLTQVSSSISASYALTASYAMNGGGGAAFPYTGSAEISGSLVLTGSFSTDRDSTINRITVGRGAGNIATNTALGSGSLVCNNTGYNNTAVGYQALTKNIGIVGFYGPIVGHSNTALGAKTLACNTYGCHNTSIGSNALRSNTYGCYNISIGSNALECNTSGCCNIAIGYSALRCNGYGAANTAIGYRALAYNVDASSNTAIGDCALLNNVYGFNNTAVGASSMLYNTSGFMNTAIGVLSLLSNTTGNRNTALGYDALRYNTSGFSNTAVGNAAIFGNTSGFHNTAVGNCSLFCNTTGTANVAVGVNALTCQNFGSTSATANVAVGYGALCANTTGTCHIAIGTRAQDTLNAAVNNTIAVGILATTSATTGHTVWGNSGNNVCNCVYAAWSTVSDLRDKTCIKTLDSKFGLSLINKLRPVSFNWDNRETYVRECKYEYGQKDSTLVSGKEHYGLIAQELKSALDELGVRFDALGHDDEKDAYRITYEELIPSIIKSIQELSQRVDELESK